MCGVSACENSQNPVSHGESVRVGSYICVRVARYTGTKIVSRY